MEWNAVWTVIVGISHSDDRSKVKGRQNSNTVLLNLGGRLLNIATDQYTGDIHNNCHPWAVHTPQLCFIQSLKMNISFDIHVIFAVAVLPCG